MDISWRLRKDMPFYEDATSAASAEVALTPGVRRAFHQFEQWVRATASLAWPRSEQATMRHFFEDYYGQNGGAEGGVPLLKFYEDFYREHFKAHVEKEGRLRGGAPRDPKDTYDVANPFGLESIKELTAARLRLTEVFRQAWADNADAEAIDISAQAVEEALQGVETLSGVPRSMGAFGLLVPAAGEGEDPTFVLHGASYTAGYGKYFSRFLYMLPDDVQEDVRKANAALTGELLAEICGDAQFNANLHPPLMRWEISYPTGESGATEDQLRSSEILVQADPEDPQNLALVHGPTGRRVIPVDLGFLNPRMRPPLYQLLSRFTPPVMYAPPIPDSPEPPRTQEKEKVDAEGVTVQPAPGGDVVDAVYAQDGDTVKDADTVKGDPADTVNREGADTVNRQPGDGDNPPPPPVDTVQARGDAPGQEPPPPVINYRPRITFGGSLVLARRRWIVPGALFPQRRQDESAAEFFLRVNRWREENGIPETAYLRVMPLPEPRPQRAGEPAAPPVEAPAEIPGYEAPAGEAEEQAVDEHEHDEAEAAPVAAEAEAKDGEAKDGEAKEGDAPAGPPKLGLEDKKRKTQPSRDFYKPQFIDFANPLLVGLLGKVAQGLKNFSANIEERYPARERLARHDGASFATELVVQLYFPGGTASATADAAELAESLPGD